MKCDKCGREFSENINFCPNCGTKVKDDVAHEEQDVLVDKESVSFNKGIFIGSAVVAGLVTILVVSLLFGESMMAFISSILVGVFLAFIAKNIVGGSYGLLASIVVFIVGCSCYGSFLESILLKDSLILALLFGMGPIWAVVTILLYSIAMDKKK